MRADVDKTFFSMVVPEVVNTMTDPDSKKPLLDIIITGIETHVCVTQTALDLLARGHRVYVVADGVSSANPEERGVALARLRDAGSIVTTSESLLFEILADAKSPSFKTVSGLVKEHGQETKEALQALCSLSKL